MLGPPDEQAFEDCVDCAISIINSSSSSSSSSTDALALSSSSTDDEFFPDFNGTDRYFQESLLNELQLPSNMKWGFSFWLVRDNNSDASIISKFNETTSEQEYSIRIVADKLEVIVKDTSENNLVNLTSTNSIPTNTLTHFVVTSNDVTTRIYINGVFDNGVVLGTEDPNQSVSDFTIGASSKTTTDDFFDGTIFFVSKWDKYLNPSNIAELYNGGLPNPCECYSPSLVSDLVSCWPFRSDTVDIFGGHNLINFNNTPFTRLHNVEDCDYSDNPGFDNSSSSEKKWNANLNSLPGPNDVRPEHMDVSGSVPFDYELFRDGLSSLNLFNAGESVNFEVENDLGEKIPISLGTAANIAKTNNIIHLLENNGGTSGLKKDSPNDIFLSSDKFRWNAFLTLFFELDGLPNINGNANIQHNTEAVTGTISFIPDSDIYDKDEPAKPEQNLSVSYSIAGLGPSEYVAELSLLDVGDNLVPFTIDGGATTTVPKKVTLDANSETAVYSDLLFDLTGFDDGDVLTLKQRLITFATDYYSNVESQINLTVVATTATLSSSTTAPRPEKTNSTPSVNYDYKLFKFGENNLDLFNAGEEVSIEVRNDLDEVIKISFGSAAEGAKTNSLTHLLENNAGTSGLIPPDNIYLGLDKFRFNAGVDIYFSLVGLPNIDGDVPVSLVTETVTGTITTLDNEAWDQDDSNKPSSSQLQVSYSVSGLGNVGESGSAYAAEVVLLDNIDTPIPFAFNGETIDDSAKILPLDENSETTLWDDVLFDLTDYNDGDAIKFRARLVTNDGNLYYANVETFQNLTVKKTATSSVQPPLALVDCGTPNANPTLFVTVHGGSSQDDFVISSVSTGSPATITTSAPHSFSNGDKVYIVSTETTPDIRGLHTVSNVTASTFTIPVNVTSVIDGSGFCSATISFLGCDWGKGETKEAYTTTYSKGAIQEYTFGESWEREVGADRLAFGCNNNTNTGYNIGAAFIRVNDISAGQTLKRNKEQYDTSTGITTITDAHISTQVAGTVGIGAAGMWAPGQTYLNAGQTMGSITTTGDITVSWTEGNGW